MENKVCFLFGHATAPSEIVAQMKVSAERQYLQYGIRTFIVGNRGNFDACAFAAIKALKLQYSDISLMLLLAYHPAERTVHLPDGFDGSFYPPLEGVPRKYAIIRANQYMVDTADSILCYVTHFGNTRNLLEYAKRKKTTIENIAEAETALNV